MPASAVRLRRVYCHPGSAQPIKAIRLRQCKRRGIGMFRVAFMGLGRMGFGMARRVLDRGHELRVFNRTAARADDLVRLGAVQCATPHEACAGANAGGSMGTDNQASRAIWYGTTGALAAQFAPGALAVECSTLSYDWVLELSAAV